MLDSPVDLGALRLASGAGAVLKVAVAAPSFTVGGNDYTCEPDPLEVRVDASRTVGEGWAFKLTFEADVAGPCTRCLSPARHQLEVVSREATRPGGGEDLESPYLEAEELDVAAWVRDSALLTMPSSVLCRPDCPGLCGECGGRLADLGPDHVHEKPPDPRWDALRRLSQ
jgi:uncharacterized protein